ncbi:hypothetical protein ACMVR0_004552, partial [Yersinia enterocolitica]|nr:hypothetical protein [Yersinia enterocolitica]
MLLSDTGSFVLSVTLYASLLFSSLLFSSLVGCSFSPGRPVGCHASHRASFAVSARPFGQRVSILTQGPACSIRKRMRRVVAPLPAL